MSENHVTISTDERELLTRILSQALKEKRVEIHRTEFSREFRRELEDEEVRIRGLLDKLAMAGTFK